MVFSSIIFLFGFLPVVLLIFHVLGKKLRLPFLLISSLFFYFFGENYLVWIILSSTIIDYCCALLISGGFQKGGIKKLEPGGNRTRIQKLGLILSIVSNLCFLGFFKYFNFFIDSFNETLTLLHLQHLRLEDVITITLPLGISFYTFQSMSYTIDVYRGRVTANRSLLRFASYVTMFPQLIAGPIVRYSHIEQQLKDHRITADNFAEGIRRFIIGLAKKVILANTMARVADRVFALNPDELTTGVAWLGVVAFALQVYFDFSGYSCMAIGLGKMLGFNFPENFNYPYISKSIKEFWQRWHITLSTWFRDYLYFPLGGSKHGIFKTYRNLIIVFFLCGLWHGASWNYVLWGLYNGIFLVLERTRFGLWLSRLPAFLQHIYAMLSFVLGLVIFRANTLAHSWQYLKTMFVLKPDKKYLIYEILQTDIVLAFLFGFIFSTPVFLILIRKMETLKPSIKPVIDVSYMIALFGLFIFCAMGLASGTYNPFIYFRF